ncbi:MAG: C_GCAxxG_C_C family protein [Clostridia bacterium]|nr:C_GCAxxG_C_C family protein [Clostridia bacterium]
MGHKELARELFIGGYNCSQAVFAAFCDVTGLAREDALRLSSSFGGGMGRMREVCGAVSGMLMVAGMLWGYTSPTDDGAKKEHYALVQSLAAQFKERTRGGSIICRELLCALSAEKKAAADTGTTPTARNDEFYKVRPCLRFVECAADLLDELIAEKGIS